MKSNQELALDIFDAMVSCGMPKANAVDAVVAIRYKLDHHTSDIISLQKNIEQTSFNASDKQERYFELNRKLGIWGGL